MKQNKKYPVLIALNPSKKLKPFKTVSIQKEVKKIWKYKLLNNWSKNSILVSWILILKKNTINKTNITCNISLVDGLKFFLISEKIPNIKIYAENNTIFNSI